MQTWESVILSQIPIIVVGFLVWAEFKKMRNILEKIEKKM